MCQMYGVQYTDIAKLQSQALLSGACWPARGAMGLIETPASQSRSMLAVGAFVAFVIMGMAAVLSTTGSTMTFAKFSDMMGEGNDQSLSHEAVSQNSVQFEEEPSSHEEPTSSLPTLSNSEKPAIVVAAAAPCKSEVDCGYAGDCVAGKCACDAAWTGPTCTSLAVLPTKVNAGLRRNSQGSWGGSVIKGEDNKYHMYVSDMKGGCSIEQWQAASQIAHATADDPQGPFKTVGVVKAPFAHNPTVHKAQDGTYVIYHIGSDASARAAALRRCDLNFAGAFVQEDHMRRAGQFPVALSVTEKVVRKFVPLSQAAKDYTLDPGMVVGVKMMTSASPNGPWKSMQSAPYGVSESVGQQPKWKCNNPAAYHGAVDGSVLLYCKFLADGPPAATARVFKYGIFKAPHWKGPYTFEKMITSDVTGEDAYVWYSKKRDAFHMIYHRWDPIGKRPTTAWSKDGINDWHALEAPRCAFNASMQLEGGKIVNVERRERHQLLINDEGEPTMLYNGVTIGDDGNGHDYSFTSAAPIRTDKSTSLETDL